MKTKKISKSCLDPTLSNTIALQTVIPAVIALGQAFLAVTQLLFAYLLWTVSGLGLCCLAFHVIELDFR